MSSREIAFAAAGASGPATYIEDVFSTYLYNGTGSVQTINNGIDLAGEGGMVWTKTRSSTYNNALVDTVRGGSYMLFSNTTGANYQLTPTYSAYSFNSNGYSNSGSPTDSLNGGNLVSWTFRKQPKFFDVVTYTGTGSARTIAHNLGSVPGMIIVKCTSAVGGWDVYHRGVNGGTNPQNYNMVLNTTAAQSASSTRWNNTAPTSTEFTVGTSANVNDPGATYVAYLFAHNAGGFGTSGTDNVISCGSFTTNGSGEVTVNLGYEPQYLLVKATGSSDQWAIVDVMRGFSQTQYNQLSANSSAAEGIGSLWNPNATGFYYGIGAPSATYIYMAIRRPMKVPTDATTVFSPNTYTEVITNPTVLTSGFATDLNFQARNNSSPSGFYWSDRLRGSTPSANNLLTSSSTAAETTFGISPSLFDSNTGIIITEAFNNTSGATDISYQFARRPGFFDEVCYTGTGGNLTVNHNLGVAPELMIVKNRTLSGRDWAVYSAPTGATKYLYLNTTDAAATFSYMWNDTAPTSSVFTVGATADVNSLSDKFVAYLFATCPGVSKVGSYTGTGATQTINCGFTGGARFVLIKGVDAASSWFVWDTARGMVSGTDPRLALNLTSAEVNQDWVYTTTTGFQIVTTSSAINASGNNYIFLAIA